MTKSTELIFSQKNVVFAIVAIFLLSIGENCITSAMLQFMGTMIEWCYQILIKNYTNRVLMLQSCTSRTIQNDRMV